MHLYIHTQQNISKNLLIHCVCPSLIIYWTTTRSKALNDLSIALATLTLSDHSLHHARQESAQLFHRRIDRRFRWRFWGSHWGSVPPIIFSNAVGISLPASSLRFTSPLSFRPITSTPPSALAKPQIHFRYSSLHDSFYSMCWFSFIYGLSIPFFSE